MRAHIGIVALLFLFLPACSTVPSLGSATGVYDPPGRYPFRSAIFMDDVTIRIKCELADAFASRSVRPSWLSEWTVKADLTLQANEQGGISPSGSYTRYQPSAVNVTAGPTTVPGTTLGTVQQFFTLTASANAGEQAVRTEVLSFSVSLKELNEWRDGRGLGLCDGPRRQELLGNLGLREWVDSALAPVEGGVLQAGKHPSPTANAKPSQPAIVAKPTAFSTNLNLVKSNSELGQKFQSELAKVQVPPGVVSQILKEQQPEKVISKENREKVDDVLSKILPSTRFVAPETTTKALLDVDAAVASVNTDLGTVGDIVRDLRAKAKTERTTTASYASVSTKETITRLRDARNAINSDIVLANHVYACVLQQLCGSQFGSCQTFFDLDGNEGHDSGKSSKDKCEPKSATCPSAGDGEVTGVLNERACVTRSTGNVENASRLAQSYAATAKSLTSYIQKAVANAAVVTPDPPIDGLGHSVQFVVAYGASITPSWTLISVKLPGLNAPAASISANRTHLLQLALGPTTSGVATEQNRIITNQDLLLNR